MVRAGGMFIAIMGAGVLLGAIIPNRRRSFLIVGAVAATVAIILAAARLSAPLGTPTRLQFMFLAGSIGAEAVLIRIAVAIYRRANERTLLLAILFAVGLHFLPMAGAFGPLCAALGVTLCACAGTGLWLNSAIPLNRLWASDGMIKITFGAIMFFAF
jgi:hypothetical protein